MSMDKYRAGDAYAICDLCGFRFYLSELKANSRGQMVCSKDWEPRHPQELRPAMRETITIENARPEKADSFLAVGDVTRDDL